MTIRPCAGACPKAGTHRTTMAAKAVASFICRVSWEGGRVTSFLGWNAWFRKQRMRRFVRELGIAAETRVLDVGGTPEMWETLAVKPRLTLLNTPRTKEDMARAAWWVAGDGRALPFRDGAFDVVFSNSVI